MSTIRTTTALVAGLVAALALTGCGNSASNTSATTPAATTAVTPAVSSSAAGLSTPAGPSIQPVTSSAAASSATETSAPSGCTPAHPGVKTLNSGKLTALVYVSPPYTTKDADGYGGVDGTIAKKLAEMECLTLDASEVAPAALIASIQANRADVAIGGIYYTAQRAKTLSLSDPMYRDGMALLSKSSLSGDIADLAGKKVGVIQGYLWDEDLQKALGSGNVKLYQDSAGMLADLSNGRLDVAVLTSAEAGYRAKQKPNLKVTEFKATPKVAASQSANNVVLASPMDATDLTSALNADIKTMLSDGTIKAALSNNGMNPNLAGPAA
ncbi:MAG: transporter substrate-binding domain-containing protein [Actinomycetota bacterium]|nr:transporter substrate-binding domain-containing protein [Actinomycetota bacterium]